MLFPLLEAFPQVWRGLAFSSRNSWVAFLSLALLDSGGFFPAPAGMVQVPVSQVSAQLSLYKEVLFRIMPSLCAPYTPCCFYQIFFLLIVLIPPGVKH